MSDEAQTKPTLETVLQRIDDFRSSVEQRLEDIETRLDRTQGIALETRADVRELRKELRAHLNQLNQPA
jgi:tetrahydromethanopterin S-methyltransferase subunit G